MPVHPPITIPVDPHVLAQWRFDERRRWEEQRDPALQAVSMVLGRWPDRLEFRTRAEVPGVSESARLIAAAADGPAYRAQLLEIASRIGSMTGVTDTPHVAEAEPVAAQAPADDPGDAADADDWLSKLDARLSSPPAPAAQDATHVAPRPAVEAADAALPDFLAAAPWESAEAAAPAAPIEEDAFYVPPSVAEPAAAPAVDLPSVSAPAVPVLDFVVEPDDAPSGNGEMPPMRLEEEEPVESPSGIGSISPPPIPTPEPVAAAPSEPVFIDEVAYAAPEPGPAPAAEAHPPVDVPQPAEAASSAAAPAPALASSTAPAASTVPPASTASSAGAGSVRERLVALGREMGLEVWGRDVAPDAGGGALPPLDAAVLRRLASVDVVWAQGGRFVGAFLVAPQPAVAGLLLLSDVLALQPGVEIPFFLVAAEADREELRREASRPTFARLTPPLAEACRFISVEKLADSLANVSAFLRYLRPEFVEALAERL
jgi:hypothetical protein